MKVTLKKEQHIIKNANMHNKSASTLKKIPKVGDKIRLKLRKGTFNKEGKNYSDEVFVIEKVNKASILIQNHTRRYKFDEILIVPQSSKNLYQNNITKTQKDLTVERRIRKEGISAANVRKRSARESVLNSRAINRLLQEEY